MGDRSHIEWTDATWNPIAGCAVVSPGCTNCYAMRQAGTRMAHLPLYAGLTTPSKAGPVWTGTMRLSETAMDQPLRWRRPRRIFVNSMSDLFHEAVPDAWIDRVFAIMALAPQHTFQILTKRPERMRTYCVDPGTRGRVWTSIAENHLHLKLAALAQAGARWGGMAPWPLPNVWLGVSVEDQVRADERMPLLLDTPAAKRFISAEPLLGPVGLRGRRWFPPTLSEHIAGVVDGKIAWTDDRGPWLNWVIVGGESGPSARPMHPDWARQIRDACAAAGVPFFFKQWGEWTGFRRSETTDNLVDGGIEVCIGGRVFRHRDVVAWLDGTVMARVGKRAAGRVLDGVEHLAWPV